MNWLPPDNKLFSKVKKITLDCYLSEVSEFVNSLKLIF